MEIDVAALLAAPTEEVFAAELAEMCAEDAPRRFALCAVQGEREDAAIVAWGVAAPDWTALHRLDGSPVGRFISPATPMRMFSRIGPVRLVWIDPEPPAPVADTAEPDE